MANPQQELDQIKAQIEKLKQQLGGKDGIDVVNIKDLATAKTLLRGLQEEADDLATSFGDMASTLASIVGELSKSDTATKSATKSYKGLLSIAQKMQYEEEGIYAYNVKQLDTLHKQAQAQLTNLKSAAERVIKEGETGKEAEAILKAYEDNLRIENDLIKAIEKRLELEKKVEKTFGATGALIEGSSKLLTTMGFGHLSSELSELGDKLKAELRDKLKESTTAAERLGLSFKYMAKGLAGSAKIFADGLTDPLFIVGKIFDTYLDINKASVDLQRLTGQNAVKFENIGANAASLKDTLEIMTELTLRTGKNAQNIFSSEVLGQAAALKTTMGLTAEEAGGIATMAQTSGKAVDDITDSVVATTSAFNGANRSAVSQGQVLRDVANTADSIKLSLGNNDVAIAKAAAAARRLGMDLGRVDEIAGSLMNFEDSIGKELEAELLTGKDLNLEKARELALTNDLAGLGEELFKNSADIAEFGKMNRIQQESYAAALGMTRDELAKIAYQRALDAGMTEKQAEAAAGVEASEMKRIAAQENFAKALEKIAGAVAPILDIVGDLLSLPLAPYLILATAAASKLGFSVSGIGKAFGSMFSAGKQAVTGLLGLFKKGGLSSALGGLKDKLAGGFGVGTGDMVQAKSGKFYGKDSPQGKMISNLSGKAGEATEAAKKIPEKSGGGMSSLTDSIQKIKPSQLLAGGAALIMIAAAVYIFAKAAQEFATVSWEDMAKAGLGLLGLVAALAAVGAIMMSGVGALAILAGAAAIVIMASGLFILGLALQEVGKGMTMMEPALALVSSIGDKAAGLATVGASLLGIADGLREIGAAGTGAIPVLQELNKLSGVAVSTGGKTAGAAKGKAEEGSMAAVAQKMDVLIELARKGTVVMLDGKVLATSNAQNQKQVLSNQR